MKLHGGRRVKPYVGKERPINLDTILVIIAVIMVGIVSLIIG